jgi:hypothetical protein
MPARRNFDEGACGDEGNTEAKQAADEGEGGRPSRLDEEDAQAGEESEEGGVGLHQVPAARKMGSDERDDPATKDGSAEKEDRGEGEPLEKVETAEDAKVRLVEGGYM